MTELTAEMVVDLRTPSDPRVSPDGRAVAFVVAPLGRTETTATSAIWTAPTGGADGARQLTAGTAEDKTPRWSPDGAWLYFLSDRAARDVAQLFRLPLAGGEAEQLTTWKVGVASFAPLPDGQTVALVCADEQDDEDDRRARDRDDAVVFGERWRPHRLRLLDLGHRQIAALGALGDRHVAEIAPSPAGDVLAAITWPTPELDQSLHHAEIHLLNVREDSVQRSWPLPTGGSSPTWDGDGARAWWLAYHAPDWRGGQTVFSASPTDPVPLRIDDPLSGCAAGLSSSTSGVLITVAQGLDTVIAEATTAEGELQPLAKLRGDVTGASLSADGTVLALIRSTREAAPDVWAGLIDGPLRQRTELNPWIRAVRWGRQERVGWTAEDGLSLDGLLVLPSDRARQDGPFPLITLVHGGPYARYADAFQLNWAPSGQWLATAGYAVFLPNPRGGQGRGHAFADTVAGAVGTEDWGDILAGIDRLIADGIANPDQLGVGGWSQGGFMSAWAVGQTDRFKAAVMGAGVSDWGMMVAESDLPHFEAMLGGSAGWEGPGPHRHDALSPISHAARARTPVLILHGAEDKRVPVSQGRFFARALREFGVPYELVVYPREPHELRERNHQLDALHRTRAWFERWLAPPTD